MSAVSDPHARRRATGKRSLLVVLANVLVGLILFLPRLFFDSSGARSAPRALSLDDVSRAARGPLLRYPRREPEHTASRSVLARGAA